MKQVHNKLYKFKNQSDAQNDPKAHTILQIAEKCLITIDEELVQKLGIRGGATVSQVEDGIGRITLIFKGTKNRTAGSYQTNPADDLADSLPNYQNHVQIHTT